MPHQVTRSAKNIVIGTLTLPESYGQSKDIRTTLTPACDNYGITKSIRKKHSLSMCDDCSRNTDDSTSVNSNHYRSQDEQISTQELHQLLASERRRLLLSQLMTHSDDPASVDDLVEGIIEHEYPDPGPETHRIRIEIDLHHVHLPKLADAGIVDYDPIAETVRYRRSQKLESLLEASNAVGVRKE